MRLVPEQIQDLTWVTLDDLLAARDDIHVHGACWAKIIDVGGEVRFQRIPPPSKCPGDGRLQDHKTHA